MNSMMLASFMPEWADWFLQVVVAPILAIALAVGLARIAVRHRYVMLLIGLLLLIGGCVTYFNYGNFLEPLCNVMSAFFPSRRRYQKGI